MDHVTSSPLPANICNCYQEQVHKNKCRKSKKVKKKSIDCTDQCYDSVVFPICRMSTHQAALRTQSTECMPPMVLSRITPTPQTLLLCCASSLPRSAATARGPAATPSTMRCCTPSLTLSRLWLRNGTWTARMRFLRGRVLGSSSPSSAGIR